MSDSRRIPLPCSVIIGVCFGAVAPGLSPQGDEMSRTPTERFDEAVAYLKDNIDAGLAKDVKEKIVGKDNIKKAGEDISLSGAGYWKKSTDEQHGAVRALLLCNVAYFRKPHSAKDVATNEQLDAIRKAMLGKSAAVVNEEIELFLPGKNPSLKGLAASAEVVNELSGVFDPFTRTRQDKTVSLNPICYNGVLAWLFHAGFVSKRWLAREGARLQASTANDVLGQGVVLKEDKWDEIPKGYLWNVHRVNDPETCHWGVSLGEDIAIACNNTDVSLVAQLEYLDKKGSTKYGKFKFTEICKVLNSHFKYGHEGKEAPKKTNIAVRQINPLECDYY